MNHPANGIRRVFRWGVEEERVPASVSHGLNPVRGLGCGLTGVREAGPAKPMPVEYVQTALPFMPPAVEAMVQLPYLAGCRQGEVCNLRTCELDMGARDLAPGTPVWIYRR